MNLLEFLLIGIFFVILFIVFDNEFTNPFINLREPYLSVHQSTIDNCKLTPKLKSGSWYPFNPSNYYGYWGFQPYKGLWGHINPWWYYPYPYPTPIDYYSCDNKKLKN